MSDSLTSISIEAAAPHVLMDEHTLALYRHGKWGNGCSCPGGGRWNPRRRRRRAKLQCGADRRNPDSYHLASRRSGPCQRLQRRRGRARKSPSKGVLLLGRL